MQRRAAQLGVRPRLLRLADYYERGRRRAAREPFDWCGYGLDGPDGPQLVPEPVGL
jgi:hypothetical protein